MTGWWIRARNDTLKLIRENNIKLNDTSNNKSTSKWKTVKRTGRALEITTKRK
jgi:hypothetical protein